MFAAATADRLTAKPTTSCIGPTAALRAEHLALLCHAHHRDVHEHHRPLACTDFRTTTPTGWLRPTPDPPDPQPPESQPPDPIHPPQAAG